MSFTWTREMQHHTTEGQNGYPLWIKMVVMQLYHLCGYTNFSHSSGAGWDPTTFTKSGTNGSFTGSSKRFTDSTASSFVAADQDAYLLIKDTTNPENCGWYKIASYVDADNIDIDYRSGATEYPTSASGLSWWIVAKGGSHPSGSGNYCRIRSPKGWEIEFKNFWWIDQYQRSNTDIRVSMNADWTGTGKIIGPWRVGQGAGYVDAPENFMRFLIADTAGDTLLMWWKLDSVGGQYGLIIAPFTPYESTPARTAIEKYILAGTGYNEGASETYINYLNWRGDTPNQLGYGLFHWNAQGGGFGNMRKAYRVQYSYSTQSQGFATEDSRPLNARTGKWDILLGVMMWTDFNDSYGEHAPLGPIGAVNESLFTVPGWNVGIAQREVVDYGGSDCDCYHIGNSIGVPWPKDITPQY
jgi:hypothetical protein